MRSLTQTERFLLAEIERRLLERRYLTLWEVGAGILWSIAFILCGIQLSFPITILQHVLTLTVMVVAVGLILGASVGAVLHLVHRPRLRILQAMIDEVLTRRQEVIVALQALHARSDGESDFPCLYARAPRLIEKLERFPYHQPS